jgi:hypothetical protein
MIIDLIHKAPFYKGNMNGLICVDGAYVPGKILGLWLELRKQVGVIQAKQKPGMRFKTRSNEEVLDKCRSVANELGILIYPTDVNGSTGFPVEDGTLASVQLGIVAQSIEDGSAIRLAGFGLGADSQDKAGGKAGTYAFKQALLQALLAQGAEDTDDTDTPIKGGVRRIKPQTTKIELPSVDEIRRRLTQITTSAEYFELRETIKKMSPEDINKIRDDAKAAKERCGA